MVINVGRSPNDRSLIEGLAGTIRSVFPSIYVMDVPDSFNSMIYATRQPTQFSNLEANLSFLVQRGGAHPILLDALMWTIQYQQPTPVSQTVYTDDWAPIEWITNSMVLNFVLFGGLEEIE